MHENKIYNEITNVIERVEVNTKVRQIQDNSDRVKAYWEIGKLIVKAQGGKEKAKYGDGLINKWCSKLTKIYGNSYNADILRRFRQYYLFFPIYDTVCHKLNWSQIRAVLPIKNENARNYYINQVILNNLSVRELQELIKSKAFDRLSYADKENVKLIEDNNYSLIIEDMIKNPILIKTDEKIDNLDEKVLHKLIIEMLEERFLELGVGFALIGHEYKVNLEGRIYRIDLLFFNLELNSYVVVEVKTKDLTHKDIGQLEFYVKYIDKNLRKINHNKTIGLLVVKKNNKYVIEYTTSQDI